MNTPCAAAALCARALLLTVVLCLCAGAVPAAAGAGTASDIVSDSIEDARFDVTDTGIDAVQAAFDTGSLSAEALTRAYLRRIETLDRAGPELNSLIAVNPHALEDAAALDAERAASDARGPLHGIPVIIRDNLDTLELPTTAGSATLRGHEPLRDAFVVERLRKAGAVILAKANLCELSLALGRYGYSSAGGQTRNAYNLRRTPASAGDGTAVAASLGLLAVGTDAAGELRGPAAVSALVGLRPTPGLTSRGGILPTALSIEVTGPMARGVRDLALALNVIAAADPADPRTTAVADRPADYTAGLGKATLEGVRLGVVDAYRGGNKEVDRAFKSALELLRVHGAELVHITLPEDVLDGRRRILGRLIETELHDQVDAYLLNTEQGMPHSLAELLRMSESPLIAGSATPVYPRRLSAYRRALRSPGLADLEYLEILSVRLPALRAAVAARFDEHDLAAIVLPTMLCPASSLLYDYDSSYDCDADDPYQPAYLASIAGLPELTLPMGWTRQGLPLGLSFVGRPFSEPRLLAIGRAFEQVADAHRPPEIPDHPPPVLESLPLNGKD
jgi:amidase